MKKKGYDLDSLIKEQEEKEQRVFQASYGQEEAEKEFIGTVEKYFSKLGVAAIKLDADISLGDIIEIGSKDEAIRQRITSMQIDRNDVSSARKGDSVGILVRCPVKEGEKVYKIY
ncbi:MAG: hypothetical protein ACP5K5_03840 [Candidatus Micrarchaeia archaeon]